MYRFLASVLTIAAVANGAVHEILVGKGGATTFNPDSLTAAVGDQLEFHFFSGSGGHSVVQSNFQSPCVAESGAFFSGYIPGNSAGDTTFVVNVTSTDPIWFFCSFLNHCIIGMSGVVNPPAGQSIADYQKAAQNVAAASAPASTGGGVLTTIATGSPSTTAPSSSATTTAGSTTTGSTSSTTTTGAATTTTSATSGGVYGKSAASRKAMPIALGLCFIMGGLVALMA